MWGNDIYLIPTAALLNMYKLKEDAHLEGKMAEEFSKLFAMYLPPNSLEIVLDSSLTSDICLDYPKDTGLGLIFMDIVQRFSLKAKINAMSKPIIRVILGEADNGCPDLESKV